MPLSADNEVVIRQWVGDDTVVTTDTLDELYDQFGTHDAVVLHVLRMRQTMYTAAPSSLSVPGLSITNSTNIAELRAFIDSFIAGGGTGLDGDDSVIMGNVTFGTLCRPDYR